MRVEMDHATGVNDMLTTCYVSDLPGPEGSHVRGEWGMDQWRDAIWVVCHGTHVFECTRAQNTMLVTNLPLPTPTSIPLQATPSSLNFHLPSLPSADSPYLLHNGPFLYHQLQSLPSGKATRCDRNHLVRHRSTRTVPPLPCPRYFLSHRRCYPSRQ